MHAGNIFAAMMSWLIVKAQGGSIVLRIEDLDGERSKQSWIDMVQRDFETLGLVWDEGPFFQHDRSDAYRAAYEKIQHVARVYPCFCTRADLRVASAPHRGEKLVYPGTCRGLSDEDIRARSVSRPPSYRLMVPNADYELDDLVQGHFAQNLSRECGDFVIRRSDGLFAYQIAVVVDDAEQGVNCVVRGMDLLVSTPQQLFLQDILGFHHPRYAHVPLLVGERDRRLSKRDRDAGMDELLARFKTPEGIIGHVAALTNLIEEEEPLSMDELLGRFDLNRLKSTFPDAVQIQWR